MLNLLDYDDFDIGILLTDNQEIQQYNAQYRKKDAPTDVLSFPFYPNLTPDEKIIPQNDDDKNLGDIIISPEYALAHNVLPGETPLQTVIRLIAHGIAHLVGHDHQTDKEHEQMQLLEEELLEVVSK